MGKILEFQKDFVTEVTYIDGEDRIKAIVRCAQKCLSFADMNGERYKAVYNDREPFDFKTQVFYFPKEEFLEIGAFTVTFYTRKPNEVFCDPCDMMIVPIEYDAKALKTEQACLAEMDRALTPVTKEEVQICEGAVYAIEHYETNAAEPVVVHALTYDPERFMMYTGTPEGTYEGKEKKGKVMEAALYEKERGQNVVAAFNADFFDIHGNLAPAGLCVKNGRVVANPDSDRYFFATTKEGKPIIDTLVGQPEKIKELEHAVCGMNLLLDEGKIVDLGYGEPFGYRPHPRTVVGLQEDGKVLILVIDGRRPWHSNGASLYEAAKLLQQHGVYKGLNMDGGGSSTFIIRNAEGELEMLNHPADLYRPFEDLIRDVFDSMIIVEKIKKANE